MWILNVSRSQSVLCKSVLCYKGQITAFVNGFLMGTVWDWRELVYFWDRDQGLHISIIPSFKILTFTCANIIVEKICNYRVCTGSWKPWKVVFFSQLDILPFVESRLAKYILRWWGGGEVYCCWVHMKGPEISPLFMESKKLDPFCRDISIWTSRKSLFSIVK